MNPATDRGPGLQAELSRRQRRELDRLCREAESAIESDRRFFARHSARNYRIRQAAVAEVRSAAFMGVHFRPAPDERVFVAVRQVAPGFRTRLFFTAPAENDTDVSEDEAEWLYGRMKARSEHVAFLDKKATAAAAAMPRRRS